VSRVREPSVLVLVVAAALAAATALLGPAVPAAAAPPSAVSPTPPAPGTAGTVRVLQPTVRVLEPEVRRLDPGVRSLRSEKTDAAGITVTISSDVLFDFDSADLTSKARGVVDATAQQLGSKGGRVTVVGHTDGVGTPPYNQRLSEARARSVADQLRSALGAGRAIDTSGRAATQPVAPETVDGHDNPEGRALNRRVVITVGG
jgi:outer membrane protein OmpA-like peptidoglycan-associated protein